MRSTLKRMMITVVVALIPCILMALYNTGYQIHRVVEQGGSLLDQLAESTVFAIATGLPLASSLAFWASHGARGRCISSRCSSVTFCSWAATLEMLFCHRARPSR
jgi:Na+-transporting NADH:ubiquinone oxidoreductase subunit NqrB